MENILRYPGFDKSIGRKFLLYKRYTDMNMINKLDWAFNAVVTLEMQSLESDLGLDGVMPQSLRVIKQTKNAKNISKLFYYYAL